MIDPSLQRKTPMKRGKPLRRTAMKRTRQPMLRGTSLRQRPPGVIPLDTREALKRREKETCQRCKRWTPNGNAHHMKLRSAGGSDELSNLAWLCESCHIVEVHGNPKRARAEGWIIGSGVKS